MPETKYKIKDGKMKPVQKDEKEKNGSSKASATTKNGFEENREGY